MSDTSSDASDGEMQTDSIENGRSLTDIFIAGQLPDLPYPSNTPTTDIMDLAKVLNLYHDTSGTKKSVAQKIRSTITFCAHVGKSLISHAVTIMIVDIYPERDTNCSSVMLRRLTRREITSSLSKLYCLPSHPLILKTYPNPRPWELESLFHFAVSVLYYSHISGNGLTHGQAFDTIRRWLRGIYEPMAAELLPILERTRLEDKKYSDDTFILEFEEEWEGLNDGDHVLQWQHFSTVTNSCLAECILLCEGRVEKCITGEGVTKLDAMREAALVVKREGFPKCC